ncbi:redoxin domain-containing protein, partial [Selenomonadales bacterium OttesenSCG-928-I06]|nr:redoxin domain-containing protein [Selenomonadales bacterium OttesenSCG-928-I06]
DVHKELTNLNTVVLGISKDSVKTHQNFKQKYNLPFPLLSDPEREIASLYDVLKEKTMYGKKVIGVERSTFIIDEKQKFRHIMRKVTVNGHAEKCLELIKEMSSNSMPHPVALLNGEYIDINDPIVPLEDRGHQFGDGVYELVRVYNSKPFWQE